jgi:hypothetical protein
MRNILSCIILNFAISGCARNNNIVHATNDCCLQKVEEITSQVLKKKRILDKVRVDSIVEDSLFITIIYSLKDERTIGGGAKFKIQKSDCTIVSFKRYQ